MIIIMIAYKRSRAREKQSYKQHLRMESRKHKHLLISPCILIVLAIPRIIISFLSGCMKSVRDPWLFLAGYYISFTPPMLIFPVFVLSSTTHRKEFMTRLTQSFVVIRQKLASIL
jgi:hypothetical protein